MLYELIIFAAVFAIFLMVAMVMAVLIAANIMTSENYVRRQTKTMMNITKELNNFEEEQD